MQTIKIKNNQCFIDVVLEATGSLSNTLLMAIENNTSITDEKAIGSECKVVGQVNKMIVDKLRVNPPATGIRILDIVEKEGISFWAINKDFIVS